MRVLRIFGSGATVALLLLAGCATRPVEFTLTPSVAATVPAETQAAHLWSLTTVDARPHDATLGGGFVGQGDLTEFVDSILRADPKLARHLGEPPSGGDQRGLRVEILRAYISPFEINLRGAVVCRVTAESGAAEAPWSETRLLRGQEVNVNWIGAGGEYRAVVRQCVFEICAELRAWLDEMEATPPVATTTAAAS